MIEDVTSILELFLCQLKPRVWIQVRQQEPPSPSYAQLEASISLTRLGIPLGKESPFACIVWEDTTDEDFG